jgi:Flp pilus assembly protein TadD
MAGQAEGALADYDALLSAQPTDVVALNGRGVSLDLLGRHREAQGSYLQARRVAPADLRTLNNLAMSLIIEGRASEAVGLLEGAARAPGAPPRLLVNLAIASAAIGDTSAAHRLLGEEVSAADIDALVRDLRAAPSRASSPG